MTLIEQNAIWSRVQMLWKQGTHNQITRGIAKLLNLEGHHRSAKVVRHGLDVRQEREAWFARLADMRRHQR